MNIDLAVEPIRFTRATRSDKLVNKIDHPARLTERRERQFVAWDGEGYTSADGAHHYALFGSSLGHRATGASLTWRQCLPLLFDAPKNAHHVIFSGTYDVIMMFHSEPVVSALLHGEPVILDQYRITYLRGKMLRVTDRELKQTRILYDVFTFFGTSFVKACNEYLGGSTLLEQVAEMKQQRNLFTQTDILKGQGVSTYMHHELELLVNLCTELRKRLALVNIHPQQWHGPGAVASTVLKREHVAKHMGDYPSEFRRNAEAAYYGGRFEQFQRGSYEGTVYQYDIRSAYPDAMRHLPPLDGVKWSHVVYGGYKCTVNPWCLYRLDVSNTNHEIGWLPHRTNNGSIYFPGFVNGWYWGVEIPDRLAYGIMEAWEPSFNDAGSKPFTFVETMYAQRAKLKAAGQPHQLALKLAMNSLYGKVAQSKGATLKPDGEWNYPTFHEVVWAGLITAYTRRKIADALHQADPSSIIATETDSIFSLEPLPLQVGTGLGEWECETLEGIRYIQSGVSLVKRDGEWSFKSRGFTVKRHQDEVNIWAEFLASQDPCLTVKQTRFGTDPRQAARFATWYETDHNLRLDNNLLEKRVHIPSPVCCNGERYDTRLHPLHVPPIPCQPSTPYRFAWNRPLESPVDDFARLVYDEPTLRLEYA